MSKFFQGIAIGVVATLVILMTWYALYSPQKKLDECRAEAEAWYLSSTALSDAIVFAALKGWPAEKVDTNVAVAFAIKGHELNCIEPKLPPG